MSDISLFCGSANRPLAEAISKYINVPLGDMTCKTFADGETQVVINESIRGNHVFLIQPTCPPVNHHTMELMVILDALRRASAREVTLVMPYFGYARQDKKVKPREPITASLVADMLQMLDVNRIVALDLHAPQIQGFFRIPVDHLYGMNIHAKYLLHEGYREKDCVVVSPDKSGVDRAQKLGDILSCDIAIIHKKRPTPNQAMVNKIVGDVAGKTCIFVDDMIDTGGSLCAGIDAVNKIGAAEVVVVCSHGLFSNNAVNRLVEHGVSKIISLDTIPANTSHNNLVVLSVAELLGEAIRRISRNISVSSLFD
jgi:ribose-phosphate pyrophosphokinase